MSGGNKPMESFANRYISILYRYSQRYFSQRLRENEIPLELGQMPCMLRVLREPGQTQEAISGQLGMDKGTVARSLCILEKQGFISRVEDPDDRRLNHIYPTPAGETLFPLLLENITQYQEMLFRGFSDADRSAAMALLSRMQANVAREMGELPLSLPDPPLSWGENH